MASITINGSNAVLTTGAAVTVSNILDLREGGLTLGGDMSVTGLTTWNAPFSSPIAQDVTIICYLRWVRSWFVKPEG